MDRFIARTNRVEFFVVKNLKSNMDRFIASVARTVVAGITYLKSNMDRFIVQKNQSCLFRAEI